MRIVPKILSYIGRYRGQILRFLIVGVITFALNYALVWVFYDVLSLNYRLAVTLAYILTVITHFNLNRTITYKKTANPILGHAGRYGIMLAFNYLITISVSMITVDLLKLSPYYGVVFAVGLTGVSSFLIMKHFVFRVWTKKVIDVSQSGGH